MDDLQDKYDYSAIVFYAFRYALGRKSYAVGEVVNYILKHWNDLQEREKRAMREEINTAIATDRIGMKMDREQWERILKKFNS